MKFWAIGLISKLFRLNVWSYFQYIFNSKELRWLMKYEHHDRIISLTNSAKLFCACVTSSYQRKISRNLSLVTGIYDTDLPPSKYAMKMNVVISYDEVKSGIFFE